MPLFDSLLLYIDLLILKTFLTIQPYMNLSVDVINSLNQGPADLAPIQLRAIAVFMQFSREIPDPDLVQAPNVQVV